MLQISRMKLKRMELRLTQQELASRVGVDRKTVSIYEQKGYGSKVYMNALSNLFGIPVNDLRGFTSIMMEDETDE